MKRLLTVLSVGMLLWGTGAAWASGCDQGKSLYQQGQYDKAFRLFSAAAKNDQSGEANFWLYRCYFNGKGVKPNSAAAIKFLKKSAQAKYVPACAALAQYYETNEFPPIGNYEGRFRGENNLEGLPREGKVFRDAWSNGAKEWSGRETQMAIAAEWYALAGEGAICADCDKGHDLADFERALGYFNKAVAIYPWMSAEREEIARQLQGALRGERVHHDGASEYRFVDTQELRDSRLAPGKLIWIMGIVEPRSSDGTGFYMRVKDSDKGYPVEVYIKLGTDKIKPHLGATMVRGKYTPASERWGTPITLYEIEEIRDMTPSGNGEAWYKK